MHVVPLLVRDERHDVSLLHQTILWLVGADALMRHCARFTIKNAQALSQLCFAGKFGSATSHPDWDQKWRSGLQTSPEWQGIRAAAESRATLEAGCQESG